VPNSFPAASMYN
ncbi:hypothetical protein SOVF_208910, partial [Spinacia oleracea]